MKKLLLGALVAVIVTSAFTGCSSSSSTTPAAGGSDTAWDLSGTLDLTGGARRISASYNSEYKKPTILQSLQPLSATQCNDGYYYQVYCVAFSEPPVSAEGNVTCTGDTGGFTVAGLPLDTGVSCFIRRNTSDTGTFTTLGTLEIPAATLGGSTSTIVGGGDIKFDISIDPDSGTISAVVAADSPSQPDTAPASVSIDAAAFSSIYQISCNSSSTSTEFNQAACKCQMGDWHAAGYGSKDACIADGGNDISSTSQYIDLSLYQGSVTSDLTITDSKGDSQTIPTGTAMYAISVWMAMSSDSSLKSGGEGFPTTGFGANISFAGAVSDPKAAVGWTNSGTISSNGISVDLTGHAAQVTTAITTGTVAGWKTYAQWLYSQSTGFTCSWGMGNATNDANCMGEFLNKIRHGYEQGGYVVPKISMERNCGGSGCDAVLANSRIFVEGVEFNYNNSSWSGSQNAVTVNTNGGIGPRPSGRHAFEQFEPSPDGLGGGFNQHEHDQQTYPCATSGAEVTSALCDQSHNWLECHKSKDMAIRFIPTSTAGTYTLSFENRSTLVRAVIGKSNNDKIDDTNPTNGAVVRALCESMGSSEDGRFLMTAVAQ